MPGSTLPNLLSSTSAASTENAEASQTTLELSDKMNSQAGGPPNQFSSLPRRSSSPPRVGNSPRRQSPYTVSTVAPSTTIHSGSQQELQRAFNKGDINLNEFRATLASRFAPSKVDDEVRWNNNSGMEYSSFDNFNEWRKILIKSGNPTCQANGLNLQALHIAREDSGVAGHKNFIADASNLGEEILSIRESVSAHEHEAANAYLSWQCKTFRKSNIIWRDARDEIKSAVDSGMNAEQAINESLAKYSSIKDHAKDHALIRHNAHVLAAKCIVRQKRREGKDVAQAVASACKEYPMLLEKDIEELH